MTAIPTSLAGDAARQACGRLEVDDAVAIATEAFDRGRRGEGHSPAGLLLVCLSNPAGAGWRMTPLDLRPHERAAMRALCLRGYAAGKAARAA